MLGSRVQQQRCAISVHGIYRCRYISVCSVAAHVSVCCIYRPTFIRCLPIDTPRPPLIDTPRPPSPVSPTSCRPAPPRPLISLQSDQHHRSCAPLTSFHRESEKNTETHLPRACPLRRRVLPTHPGRHWSLNRGQHCPIRDWSRGPYSPTFSLPPSPPLSPPPSLPLSALAAHTPCVGRDSQKSVSYYIY